ncbi:hypothetical protein ANCCAN_00307 [Ancylostoma caninum]|uniref:Uncharacterized protein n=1 Tax=Ancylostoma caninum TaxID=29170 RepID=A0A368HB26_ANCCA|nr:hypothetical protein ANCCAN_00307 [Ancylostoma caninum]
MSARGPSSDNLGDSTPSAENIRGSTSIARESGVEQETAPDDAGKVKKSMHDETATTDDVHAQTDLIPIPTTTVYVGLKAGSLVYGMWTEGIIRGAQVRAARPL